MKKGILLSVLLMVLTGCSLFGGVADKIADTVDAYCTKESFAAREVYRGEINNALLPDGHSVDVICKGDPVNAEPTAHMNTGKFRTEASTKTQEDLISWQEQDTQPMLLSVQPRPPLLSQLSQGPSLSFQTVPQIWGFLVPPLLQISQPSKPSLPHFGQNSVSRPLHYSLNSPGFRNSIFS